MENPALWANLKTLKKRKEDDEQALRDLFSEKIKKYRRLRGLSQFNLAAKADISSNFIADMEGARTGASFATLIKLGKAFEIEAYELIKPEDDDKLTKGEGWGNGEVDRYTHDVAAALRVAVDKTLARVKKEHRKNAKPPPP